MCSIPPSLPSTLRLQPPALPPAFSPLLSFPVLRLFLSCVQYLPAPPSVEARKARLTWQRLSAVKTSRIVKRFLPLRVSFRPAQRIFCWLRHCGQFLRKVLAGLRLALAAPAFGVGAGCCPLYVSAGQRGMSGLELIEV